ncbi:MAG: hypothetical protein KKD73_02750, partial [Proteobacteria bacterium]|nr:hypothetical protein [Pseudomonadota bacterium]MBU1640512.1 hypothetical protein [Pseudomonadota bacterium]
GTEKYCVMDHIMNAPWMPPLVEIQRDPITDELMNLGDFTTRWKDDGKILYQWGNYKKRPTQLRLYKQMPVPAAWKVAGADYVIKSAKLTVTHRITTSPNDQIRPEDYENEWASGIKPGYIVDSSGRWLSDKDAFEGDGDFIPAGTVLKDPALADITAPAVDLWYGYTNAWYTSMDRDPFGGDNPRYRLKSSKYGQDIPGVEIPAYIAGQLSTTTIDLLAWGYRDEITKVVNPNFPSPLTQSTGWVDNNDLNPLDPTDTVKDGISYEGCPLTPDLDLMLYIKGEYSGTDVMDAQLIIEWEDPAYTGDDNPPTGGDVDLLTVTQAEYITAQTVLKVEATSDAGEIANLSIIYGGVTRAMVYDAANDVFKIGLPGVAYYPEVTVISELGSAITVPVSIR